MAKATRPKGHWPRGKRRNPDRGDWSEIRLGLTALLRDHHEAGVISAAQLAAALGVYTKTVTRWLNGTTRPPVVTQGMIAAWTAEQRARVAARRRAK